jgi:tryptophan synthase alpha chain
MSVAGITGERTELPPELGENVAALKAAGGGKPVFVGFGIGRAEQVALVTQVADGAIVGSALVRRMSDGVAARGGPEQIAATVREYVQELRTGLTGAVGSPETAPK